MANRRESLYRGKNIYYSIFCDKRDIYLHAGKRRKKQGWKFLLYDRFSSDASHFEAHVYYKFDFIGSEPKKVQYLAGHADIKVTLDIYTRLVDQHPNNFVDEVNKAFEVKSKVKTG